MADLRYSKLTLSLILRFNLRLGGYSIWSATTRHTPIYIKDFQKTPRPLGQEHLAASAQLVKNSEDAIRAKLQGSLDSSEVLEDLRLLGHEELGGLSDPRPQGTRCGPNRYHV